jgi:RNA polymerase sigma factor (sigma-70 family)
MQITLPRRESTATTLTRRPACGACDAASLTRRAAQGDQQAWSELIERHSSLLWAIARRHRLGAADAADVFQTTWLRLVEHIDGLTEPERVGAWLATTARRECLRVLRAASRELPMGDALPEPAAAADEPAARLMRAERDAELWAAFARLSPRDRALLRLLVADPAPSYDEIAAVLGMPIGSIGPTRGRCLARLRDALPALG